MDINLSCAINRTGYGVASLNIFRELCKNNSVSYFPIDRPYIDNENDHNLIQEAYNRGSLANPNAPYIKIWHQFDLMQRVGKGRYYAFPFFELDKFNNRELIHLSVPDCIFTTSQWGKDVIINNGIKSQVEIVPLGVDRDIFNENYPLVNKNKYIFLNIGKWEVRKGHDILLELFLKAFPYEKDVELWICAAENTNSYSSQEDLIKWKNMYNHQNIKIISGVNTQKDLALLINSSDCGLYPSRAEGWNLELLETMSMNKPVIATNYSAHTEFCTKNNAFLIDIDKIEKAYDGKAFNGQGNWAKIGETEKDQIIDYMRYIFKNNINTNNEGVNTAKTLSWEHSAQNIHKYLSS